MTDTIAEQGAIRQGIQDALNGVTPNAQTTAGFANNVIRQYLSGAIRFNGNRQTPRGRIIGYMLDNNLFVDFGLSSTTLDPRITWTRASTKTYYDIAGVRQTAAINEAPLEYDPITHELLGRSVWEARTNSLLNSGAPVTQVVTLGVGTYTLWVEGSGSATSSALTAIGSGFGAATAGSPNVFTVSTGGTVTVTVAGSLTVFQLENGAFATPYIPTTDFAATRAADVASVTGTNFSSWYNQSEGTLFAEFMFPTSFSTSPSTALSIDNASAANELSLRTTTSHLGYSATGTVNSTTLTNINNATIADDAGAGVWMKEALAYKSGDSILCAGGTLGTPSTTIFSGGTFTTARMGANRVGAAQMNGYIRSIKYYPTRLADAQLQVITT
jgi:hypothetical protein